MRLGISFNGAQFVYLDFKYDRLADAVEYAGSESERSHNPPPTQNSDWQARLVPSVTDEVQMKLWGIVFLGGKFRFCDYSYDHLVDALNYAMNHQTQLG